jgi:stress-induced morphogen
MLQFTRRLFFIPRAVGTFTTAATQRNANASNGPPSNLSEEEQNIYDKLTAKFTASHIQVQDVSGERRPYFVSFIAHSSKGGCGTFYAISVSSPAFQGLSTLKQHKLVTETLKLEIAGIHGFQVPHPSSLFVCACSQPIHDLDKNECPVGNQTFASNGMIEDYFYCP